MIDTTIPVNIRDLFLANVSNVELSSAGHRVKALIELTSIKTKSKLIIETLSELSAPVSKEDCEASVQRWILDAWNNTLDSEAGRQIVDVTADITWDQIRDWALLELAKPSKCHTLDI